MSQLTDPIKTREDIDNLIEERRVKAQMIKMEKVKSQSKLREE